MCRGVLSPALHLDWADRTLGTLQLHENFASPMQSVVNNILKFNFLFIFIHLIRSRFSKH